MTLASLSLFAALAAARPAAAAWVGDAAPPFELPRALSTGTVSLASQRGKVVFVHFWATWCSSCKEELPKLDALAAARPKDLALLAITVDSAPEKVARFLAKVLPEGPRVTVLADQAGETARAYRTRSMPITYVVDPEGVIRKVHLGFQEGDEARWRAEIDELKPKAPPGAPR